MSLDFDCYLLGTYISAMNRFCNQLFVSFSLVTGMLAESLTVDDYQGWRGLLFLCVCHSSQFDNADILHY